MGVTPVAAVAPVAVTVTVTEGAAEVDAASEAEEAAAAPLVVDGVDGSVVGINSLCTSFVSASS